MSRQSKKVILLGIVIIAVIGSTYYFLKARIKTPLAPSPMVTGSVLNVNGTIVENVKFGDTNALLKLKNDDGDSGEIARVLYAGASCAYPFKQAFSMRAGEKIKVYGQAVAGDTISVCPSGQYYIRVVK